MPLDELRYPDDLGRIVVRDVLRAKSLKLPKVPGLVAGTMRLRLLISRPSFATWRLRLQDVLNTGMTKVSPSASSVWRSCGERQPPSLLVRRSDLCVPFFPGDAGETVQGPRGWFHNAVQRAEVLNYTWHCHRHTFASRLVMAGVDLRTVGELLGHKSPAMTYRYAHLAPAHTLNAVDRLVKCN